MRLTAVVIFVAVGGSAHAETVAVGLDYTAARGSRLGDIDLGWRLEAGPFVQVGRWHATGSFAGFLDMKSDENLGGYTMGARLAYHWSAFHVGAGFERVWLRSDGPVMRTCRQTNACVAGYFMEVARYDSWAPQLRVGIGAYAPSRTTALGISFEVIVEPLRIQQETGLAAWAALTATLGTKTSGSFPSADRD